MRKLVIVALVGLLAACGRSEPVSSEASWFTFAFPEGNRGSFRLQLQEEARIVEQEAIFRSGEEVIISRFDLACDPTWTPLRWRMDENGWRSVERPRHYPTCAWPVLLPLAQPHYEYVAVHDSSGKILGPTRLERRGRTITERRNGQTVRSFRLDKADRVIAIDWGGPTSTRVDDRETAIAGSGLE